MNSVRYSLVGVGIGPFNLSLAALADSLDVSTLFLEQKQTFSWHPGLLLQGSKLQVPFLADLVTMVDPTSRWSYLSYLQEHNRLFQFFFSERFEVPRREYEHYLQWVSGSLDNCRFGTKVINVTWSRADDGFRVDIKRRDGTIESVIADNVVIGIGSDPFIPTTPYHTAETRDAVAVIHASQYLNRRETIRNCNRVAVVGGGQSGAEIVLDLIREQDATGNNGPTPIWLSRTRSFAPMEYSKLGLQHFTPDYVEYFFNLPEETRTNLAKEQWQLYKAVSNQTLTDIHDELYERTIGGRRPNAQFRPAVEVQDLQPDGNGGYTLSCWHIYKKETTLIHTDAVVWATGYRSKVPTFLRDLQSIILRDARGELAIQRDYSIGLREKLSGNIYVQNGELHTHGVGAPDLTLGAWRAAQILNSVTGRESFRIAAEVAWTEFG